ncbi:MAG: restriction endonuclease [Nitrospirota bacterium]|nr:restriction endonuclease [Nitrospirota bacterium]
MAITILKASGQPEEFDIQKLVNSLIRSGAPADAAEDIAGEVAKKLTLSTKTKDIYRMARKLLKHYNLAAGMRYSLKKALSSLGPSGYPFEQYVGRILQGHGYSVEVGQIISGYCVKHEVDVVAKNGDEHFIIECKYHSDGGKPTDVKVALYIHSRFNDIRKAFELMPGQGHYVYQGWLVTNTRCTTDAIQYAECVGLRIMSWRYPETGSLEKMIEEKRLYPATILPSARRKSLEALFRNNFILAQDIADVDEEVFLRKSGLDHRTARSIKREADEICPCTP